MRWYKVEVEIQSTPKSKMSEVRRKIIDSSVKYEHRTQTHKPSMDIQKLEWDKRQKR
jgi:hypothetical protein